MQSIVTVTVAAALLLGVCVAQEDRSTSGSFEAASVRRSARGTREFYSLPPSGNVVIANMELRRIIGHAYEIERSLEHLKLRGGTKAVLSERFDIRGTPPAGAAAGQARAMLRGLLLERFALRAHTDRTKMPVFRLSLERQGVLGPKLRRSAHDCTALIAAGAVKDDTDAPRSADGRLLCWGSYGFGVTGPGTLEMRFAGPLSTFINRLQPFLDRPIQDVTGLSGNFEWHLLFARSPQGASESPAIVPALTEQLGLKLTGAIGEVDVLVIDSVQLPSP